MVPEGQSRSTPVMERNEARLGGLVSEVEAPELTPACSNGLAVASSRPGRSSPDLLHQRLVEQIYQAVRSVIDPPGRRLRWQVSSAGSATSFRDVTGGLA